MSINTEEQLIQGILNHGTKILDHCLADPEIIGRYKKILDKEKLRYPIPKTQIDKNQWFIPKTYQDMDIEAFLVSICPKSNIERLESELVLYRKNNMVPVLKTIKYIVDTLRENNVVWGVGRGSSVASYVLFLLGIHKIDSVKYNLPIEEFFKGEQNG
jgi:DNA polymerase III alpha subunit